MKLLRTFMGLWVLTALMALNSCDNAEPENTDGETSVRKDDAYYAALAGISSSDAEFTATDDGGTIYFKTEGGEVVVNVDCGTVWAVTNDAADIFSTVVDASAGTLTITAVQNTVEEELSGTIVLMTDYQRLKFATITVIQNAYGAPELTIGATEWKVPANSSLTTDIEVECSLEDYEVSIVANWLSYEKTASGITLTASENQTTDTRSAAVTVTATDGIRTKSETLTVTQDGKAYITLSRETVALGSFADSYSFTTESNFTVEYSGASVDWLSVEANGNTITVSSPEYTGEEAREGKVVLTAGDGAENTTEVEFTAKQLGINTMCLAYAVYSGQSIILPIIGTGAEVDWGDGSEIEQVASWPSHKYSTAGEYNVFIDGDVSSLQSNTSSISSSANPNTTLIAVRQWGKTGLTKMETAFYCNQSLESVAPDTYGALADVESFQMAFRGCSSLTDLPEDLFSHCTSATTFRSTFYECTALKTIPSGLFKNCSAAETFYMTFCGCSSLVDVPEDLFEDCTGAESFYSVFNRCYSLQTVPAGLFKNSPKATEFQYVFMDCQSLTAVPDGMFEGCTGATDFTQAFYNCYSLTEIGKNVFTDCTEVEAFTHAFHDCYRLTQIPADLFSKCSKVTDFSSVFYDCLGLTEVPEGLFDNCPEVSGFSFAFRACKGIKTIPVGLFDNCRKVTEFQTTFWNCIEWEGESPYTVLDDGTKVHLYERSSDLGFADVIYKATCFSYCTNLTDYYDISSDWGGGAPLQPSVAVVSAAETESQGKYVSEAPPDAA